jgi:hypothetical protein
MMKHFMVLRFLTRGMKLDEDLGGSNTMPFPREDAVILVYDGCPPPGRHRVSKLSPGPLTCCSWGHRCVKVQIFQYIYIC